ncbi:RNA polymerase sigma factor [Humisphaera borealis]|uniref:Sigma-70 family RNA polymerase sigma factor n=1 Tax=Humisphaera borealis TaxID=2807512 RepID=A0A7M2WYC0_9BACT|nr:sigma-70 family RNA polymerase sigma factor [Humisphaera borealis]QOV90419.1 sigma-70 family RNA polymerase sigma factor [Humisphaera borealis]
MTDPQTAGKVTADPTAGNPPPASPMAPAAAPPSDGGPPDGMLVERTIAGDRTAFDMLIRRYQRQAVAVSYRLLGNTHDALEVTQDAFLKSYSSLTTLQKADAFGGWLMRIVSNLSLNYRRSRKTRSQLPLDDLLGPNEPSASDVGGGSDWMSQSGDPVHKLQSREMGKRLAAAMQELPEKQRLAIVMFTIEEMPQKQVADALGCSVEAVKWHVFQGRKKLRELLKEHL